MSQNVILKGTLTYVRSYLPSLATSSDNMASHRERIMEKTRKFHIVYAGPKTFVNIPQPTSR